MNKYAKRNELLNQMGFKNYKAYLKSDLWAKIRAQQLRTHPFCYACGRKATQVHHGRYSLDVMLGHAPHQLFSTCGGCHFKSEFTSEGVKRGPNKATKRMKSLRQFWDSHRPLAISMYVYRKDNVDEDFKRRLEREP